MSQTDKPDPRYTSQPATKKWSPVPWEYHTLDVDRTLPVIPIANQLGLQGWEMSGVVLIGDGNSKHRLYFKRPKV